MLDLLPASGASPCLLAPKSSLPAGAGGAPRSTERGPPPRRTAHSSVQPRFQAECGDSVEEGERRGGDEVQHTGEEQKRGIQIPALRTLRNPKPPSRVTINLPREAGWERKRGSPIPVPRKRTSPPFYRLSYSSPLFCFSSSVQRLFNVGEFEAVEENCFLLQH